MKNTIVRKTIATVMVVIIAISSLCTIAAVSASAKTYDGSAQGNASQKIETVTTNVPAVTTKLNKTAKAYKFVCTGQTKKGYDWDYTANNNNIKVKCSYDFKTHTYTFKFTGTAKGATNMNFKYRLNDKTWVKVPMTFKVDAQKNIMRTK